MSHKAARFDSLLLRQRLLAYPKVRRYLVGFSGGADSTALLTALHAEQGHLDASIEAVHFNHGLQAEAGSWQRHCERFCAERDIPLTSHTFEIPNRRGNLEARARNLRYGYIEEHIDAGAMYLTAHNADDRAETFLLHALRGSGLDGLASIPEIRALGSGYVARPLLDFSRQALVAYLGHEHVEWIEDPSNLDIDVDRNFIRREVIPLLESRWPAARDSLARTARHLRTASIVLQDLLTDQAGLDSHQALQLPLGTLDSLGDSARSLILRAWLRGQGAPPMPEARLEEFLGQVATAAPGSQCETAWADWTLKKFRDELRLIPPGEYPECPERDWDATSTLDLGAGLGTLRISGSTGGMRQALTVGPRKPGRRIQIHSRGPHRKLKKVFQEQPIPPWQRQSIPVLYRGDQAVAIGDWLFAPEFEAWLSQHGLVYRWAPEEPELRRSQANCHKCLTRQTSA